MAADRAQHVADVIDPALAAGRWVVTDRFSASTLAYQGYGRGLDRGELEALVGWATGGLRPDLTVLFDLPVEVAAARRRAGGAARPDGGRRDWRSSSGWPTGYRALAAERAGAVAGGRRHRPGRRRWRPRCGTPSGALGRPGGDPVSRPRSADPAAGTRRLFAGGGGPGAGGGPARVGGPPPGPRLPLPRAPGIGQAGGGPGPGRRPAVPRRRLRRVQLVPAGPGRHPSRTW